MLDFLPNLGQFQPVDPVRQIVLFQTFISYHRDDAADVADMFWLAAQTVVLQLVEDQILRRMDICFADVRAEVDEQAALQRAWPAEDRRAAAGKSSNL